ncbi:MAG: T9SS type A sorting domain-containing protein [Crocinitomicaceae bacterium]|nr:T9SS type A sorting domain-containing protein [Crocinitomicaceae bacterium]
MSLYCPQKSTFSETTISEGIYFVTLINNGSSYVQKLIVTK